MNKNKKHYLIYQTINLINGKIYIGKHETINIEDEYFGSGNLIRAAINKYGLENFVKTILFELQNEEEMNLLEKCVVTQEFCDREDTYNINVGGDGGWDYVNSDKSSYGKGSKKRHNAMILANKNRDLQQQASKCKDSFNRIKQNKQQFDEFLLHVSNGVKRHKMNNPDWMVKDNNPMYGKTHTTEAKEKMSKHAQEHNPMRGKIWICNFELEESKIWNVKDPLPDGWVKGRHAKTQFKKIKKQLHENELKKKKQLQDKEAKLKLYHEMYEEFKLHEFEGVVKKFGYTHTRNNLIMSFRKYIPEYIPKKCNRWKNKK